MIRQTKPHGTPHPDEIKVDPPARVLNCQTKCILPSSSDRPIYGQEVILVTTHTKYRPLSERCSNFPNPYIASEGQPKS